MTNHHDQERERLSQASILSRINKDPSPTEMLTVYNSDRNESHRYSVYCALVPNAMVEESLNNTIWDLMHEGGFPGTIVHYEQGIDSVVYYRYGNDCGIEPLVIERGFQGIRPCYLELCEEFRHFHRLYYDRTQDHFLKFDDNGNEELVAIIETDRVQIRLKEIRQFLAIKEMHLSIQFDNAEFSTSSLEDLSLQEGGMDTRDEYMCWGLYYGGSSGLDSCRAFSHSRGKRFIRPLPKNKSGFSGFADEGQKKYQDFIIGVDENGDNVTHSSDPDSFGDNFETDRNRNAPNYLTPVHFKKHVLDKYYNKSSLYRIADGKLCCADLWIMTIDNHHDDYVCAWLGDLGRDLPYDEQRYWSTYNIPPNGKMSDTFILRQVYSEFTDSDRPEHIFQERYNGLTKKCDKCLGWQLLLPLSPGDKYHLQGIRIPSTDEQKDFDDLVLGLTKILIDSLNESELRSLIRQADVPKGGINRLKCVFDDHGIIGYENHISFLRNLQELRSTSLAHRKGSNYLQVAKKFGINNTSHRNVFRGILQQAVGFLEYLIEIVQSKKLNN